MFLTGGQAFKQQEYKRVTNGWDREGHVCGQGKCAEYPFRYFPFSPGGLPLPDKPVSAYFALCVDHCPSYANSSVHSIDKIKPCDPSKDGKNTKILQSVVDTAKSWTQPNHPYPLADTKTYFEHYCVPAVLEKSLAENKAVTSGQTELSSFVKAIGEAQNVLIAAVILAFVLSFFFLLLLRFCGGPIVLLLVIACIGAFGVAGYLLSTGKINGETLAESTTPNIAHGMKALGYVSYAAAALLLVFCCCIRRQLMMAVKVISEGTNALTMNKRLLFVPILKFFLLAGVLAFTACACVSIVVGGDMKTIRVGGPDEVVAACKANTKCVGLYEKMHKVDPANCATPASCEYSYQRLNVDDEERYYLLIQLFGFFWSVNVLIFAGQMAIAIAIAIWYFDQHGSGASTGVASDVETSTSPMCTGLYHAFVTHFGSVCFGALIITAVQALRACLEYIKAKSKKEGAEQSKLIKVLLCTCTVCLCCLECCLKFVMQEAFTVMAIFGKNFCRSCQDSYGLITRNTIRLGSLHLIGDSAVVVGKLFVSVFTTLAGYLLMTRSSSHSDFANSSPLLPTMLIFISSWLVASLFMQVYSQTINTLMVCFIVDEEVNGDAKHAPMGLRRQIDEYGGDKGITPRSADGL